MTEMTSYTPGTFCWVDLSTNDAEAAKKFYTELFGWTANDMPAGPDMIYTMGQIEGQDVAGLYQQGPQEQGVPPHWNSYVSVASANEIAAKAKSLGGTVLGEPFDVLDSGRMALVQDPEGAVVGAWEPRRHIGSRLIGQPGTVCWNELGTRDAAKAADFYTKLFGWEAQVQDVAGMPYTMIYKDGQMKGGIFELNEQSGDTPPGWMVDFAVADCDASAAKVTELGGKVLLPPTDIPTIGRFAMVQDPQGAVFSIIKLENPS